MGHTRGYGSVQSALIGTGLTAGDYFFKRHEQ